MGGEIGTEILICILKGNNTDYQCVPVRSYCRKEVHLHGFLKPQKSLVLAFAHKHMYLCISGLCTNVWTSVTIWLLSPTGIQQ